MMQPTDRFGILRNASLRSRSWLYHPNSSHHSLVGKMYQPESSETSLDTISPASLSIQLDGVELRPKISIPSIELPNAPRRPSTRRDVVPFIFLLTFSALLLSFTTIIVVLTLTAKRPSYSQAPSTYAKLASAYMAQFEAALVQKEVRPQLERQLKQQVGSVLNKVGVPKTTAVSLAPILVSEGISASMDPLFVAAVVRHESTFNPRAVSPKGAMGLMQLLPSTALYMSQKNNILWRGDNSLFDAQYNVRLGVRYLRYLHGNFDNWEHILIAYNWGPGNLSSALRNGSSVPQSTLRYARSIIETHAKWRDENNLSSSSHG